MYIHVAFEHDLLEPCFLIQDKFKIVACVIVLQSRYIQNIVMSQLESALNGFSLPYDFVTLRSVTDFLFVWEFGKKAVTRPWGNPATSAVRYSM